jgi:hypothetical protein
MVCYFADGVHHARVSHAPRTHACTHTHALPAVRHAVAVGRAENDFDICAQLLQRCELLAEEMSVHIEK